MRNVTGTIKSVQALEAKIGAANVALARDVLIPKGARVVMPLPPETSIEKMGLDAATINQLSPNAKALTKADLIALWQLPDPTLSPKVTANDISVIRNGFGQQVTGNIGGPAALTVNCCCCPCCCATSPMQDQQALVA